MKLKMTGAKDMFNIKKPAIIATSFSIGVVLLFIYFLLLPGNDIEVKGGEENALIAWITLATAIISLLTAVVGLVTQLITSRR